MLDLSVGNGVLGSEVDVLSVWLSRVSLGGSDCAIDIDGLN